MSTQVVCDRCGSVVCAREGWYSVEASRFSSLAEGKVMRADLCPRCWGLAKEFLRGGKGAAS